MKEDEKGKKRANGQTRGQKIAKTRPTPADRGDGVQCAKSDPQDIAMNVSLIPEKDKYTLRMKERQEMGEERWEMVECWMTAENKKTRPRDWDRKSRFEF